MGSQKVCYTDIGSYVYVMANILCGIEENKHNNGLNTKPNSGSIGTISVEPFEANNGPEGETKIKKIVKLVNMRDPPNKLFESSVDLANKDAWKRRSIYMSKAQYNFEAPDVDQVRHSVNVPFDIPLINSNKNDDCSDDHLWNNVDECISVHDRIIPVIPTPKCLSALKDRYLPQGIQNMLKNSTRFSHSFHIKRDAKGVKRDSEMMFKHAKKHNSNNLDVFEKARKISQAMKSGSSSSDYDDNCNIDDEEEYTPEATLAHQCDNLRRYSIDTKFKLPPPQQDDLGRISKNLEIVGNVHQNDYEKSIKLRDNQMNKIEDLDYRRETVTEMTKKPAKEVSEKLVKQESDNKPAKSKDINSMVTKVASPFEVAPPTKKKTEELKRIDSTESSSSIKKMPSNGKDDSDSIDLWRASQMSNGERDSAPIESNKNDFCSKMSKDELFDQWYNQKPRSNGTITEDVDAENAEDSNRVSESSIHSASSYRNSDAYQEPPQQVKPVTNDQPEEENELHQIHMLQSLQALQYMKNVPLPHIDDIRHRMVYLPEFKHSNITKTLIFDMDETLIHCVDDIEEENPQHVLTVRFDDGEEVDAGINIRPYAIDCLKAANEIFQVIVFTASHK